MIRLKKRINDCGTIYRTFSVMVMANALIASMRFVETRSVKINTMVSCDNIPSQQYYSLSDMSGTWYGIEIIEHVTKGRPTADTCIKVNIRQQEGNYIDLEWRERDFSVNYKFVILDQMHRGNWTSQGPQSVTGTPDGYVYEQFAGNVFIMKASDTNVVLTFCSLPNKLYSLVLTKMYAINETELSTIHNLVQRFGMPKPVEIKKYCKNNGDSHKSHRTLIFLTAVAVSLLRKLND